MKKRSMLAVMSLATGAFIAAVSPPPAAQADTLDGALTGGEALSQLDAPTAGLADEVGETVRDATGDLA